MSRYSFQYPLLISWMKWFPSSTIQVVVLPIVDELLPSPEGMPLSVPRDLYQTIRLFHGQPFVWWIGQFCKYLFRFTDKLQTEIARRTHDLGFRKPIVGVHIRRTDKIDYEAQSHSAEEYMYWVDLYFNKLSLRKGMRFSFKTSEDDTIWWITNLQNGSNVAGCIMNKIMFLIYHLWRCL